VRTPPSPGKGQCPQTRQIHQSCMDPAINAGTYNHTPPICGHDLTRNSTSFFTLVTGPRRSLSLKLSDTRVYAPQIRARLGITAHFCKVVVLKLRADASEQG